MDTHHETQVRLARIIAYRVHIRVGRFLDFEDLIQEAWLCVDYLWKLFDASTRYSSRMQREPFIIGYGTMHLRRKILRDLGKVKRYTVSDRIDKTILPEPLEDSPTEVAQAFGGKMSSRRKEILRLLAEGLNLNQIAKQLGTSRPLIAYYVRGFQYAR